jgi:RNA polymerase primary sigma factor
VETVYAFDSKIEEIIKAGESVPFISTGHEATGHAEDVPVAQASADARENKDVLAPYLKELRASVLLKPHEELELSMENIEQEQKKHELTEQLMLFIAQQISKRRLMTAPADAHQQVRICVSAALLQRRIRKFERSIQQSVPGSYERRKLSGNKAQAVNEFRDTVLRVDLCALKERAILREINSFKRAGARQKMRIEKEFQRLVQGIQAAETRAQAARNRLVKSNLRLVVGIARRYLHWGMPISDIIQEGNIGLMRAAEKFDYRLGARFSTYASWWIRQAIVRCIDAQKNSIRLPVYINERCKKMRRLTRQIVQDTGAEPMPASLAETMGISSRHIDQMQLILQDTISLETPAGKEDGPLKYFIVDPAASSPLDEVLREQRMQTADQALQVLAPREQEIIRMRYGIGDDAEHTLEEIGQRFGLSRERIRQLEDKALNKLKHSRKIYELMQSFASV